MSPRIVDRVALEAFLPHFIERHWPKNDTAAQGGAPTPGRGEATVTLVRFIAEVFGAGEAEPGPGSE